MAETFCVSITHCRKDTDRVTVGFVVANAALGSELDTLVFLSTDGVWAAVKGEAEKINEGAAPGDRVSGDQLRGRVQRNDGTICTKHADKPTTDADLPDGEPTGQLPSSAFSMWCRSRGSKPKRLESCS